MPTRAALNAHSRLAEDDGFGVVEHDPGFTVPADGAGQDLALDVAAGAADGILVCLGDRFCGYALYVLDGHLVHDYNAAGTHHVARSAAPVPARAATLRYTFDKTGDLAGTGTVTIDGEHAGVVALPRTLADWSYDRIALNRYALFGRTDRCMIPPPAWHARFID